MTQGSNPFDDDFDNAGASSTNVNKSTDGTGRPSKNPFDDDDTEVHDDGEQGVAPAIINKGINPFESSSFDNPGDESRDDDEPTGLQNASAEASWQYLGDLPYRRVPIYSNVRWNRHSNDNSKKHNAEGLQHGLAAFPPSVAQHHPAMLDDRELRALLNTTTVTKVAGCPHGGPVAAITLPIVGHSGSFAHAELRIMTNSGLPLSTIEFPPPNLERRYSPGDIMEIGFTDRYILMVVLRDSLCLTYDLHGAFVLQPFHILPRGEGKAMELIQANVYDGGVAVLSSSKHSAIVEMLDDHDPTDYSSGAHIAARTIRPTATATSEAFGGQDNVLPPHSAIVTHLPTAAYASNHFYSFMAIAALSRTRTTSRHPDVFLSTSDNSVIVVNTTTCEITDVDCRARISSPIVDMTFAPNGRFLACFTESSMLTVISTSFETKVLDFDTSEGSASPPLAMQWCGEDR